MICIAYATNDPVSMHAAEYVRKECGIEEKGKKSKGGITLLNAGGSLVNADSLDSMGFSHILFLSKHYSSAGIVSFTAHSLGNWNSEAMVGGKPGALSTAAPELVRLCMMNLKKSAPETINTVLETTHHGPLLDTPCTFIELGGNDHAINDIKLAEILGKAAADSAFALAECNSGYNHVAIGLGGNHYPSKFTKLCTEKGYAFGHIMPSHAFINDDGTDNIEMISQAATRSDREPEFAVIEWKSFNSIVRNKVLKKLGDMGMDYERV